MAWNLIVITGDKGLAGAFNTNILKAAQRFLASKQGKNIEIETYGRKGRDFLKRRYPGADPRPFPDRDVAEHFCAGRKQHAVADLGMAIAAFFAGSAERDVLEDRDVVADDRCLADDDPGCMVDEHPDAEARRRVNVDLEDLRNAALQIGRQLAPACVPEHVTDPM